MACFINETDILITFLFYDGDYRLKNVKESGIKENVLEADLT